MERLEENNKTIIKSLYQNYLTQKKIFRFQQICVQISEFDKMILLYKAH